MSILKVEQVTQPAILVQDMDSAMRWMYEMFGAYPSERVNIVRSGLNNAVYAFHDTSTIELIEPYNPQSSAYRLLQRTGPGWHMLTMDIEKHEYAALDAAIEDTGIRVVQKEGPPRAGWHLHPKDTHGLLLYLGDRADHDDLGPWAGHPWREYVSTNTHVIRSVMGVSLTVDNLDAARETYTKLGLTFGHAFHDGHDEVVEATATRGNVLQLRHGLTESSPARAWRNERGEGLFHLILRAPSLEVVRDRLYRVGGRIVEEGTGILVTDAASTLGVRMEFRAMPN